MHFTIAEKEPPGHVKLLGHGTGIGSTLVLEATMDFAESDDGTLVKWQAETKVRGRIATFGERLLLGQAEKFVNHLFGCLEKKVEQGSH